MPAEEDMKKSLSFLINLFLICILVFTGCNKSDSNRSEELIIYTYNSFSGEWGAGPEIARLFKEKTGISVTYADCGDSAQILSKAIMEKNNPYADVLVGLDNNMVEKVTAAKVLIDFEPSNSHLLSDTLESQLGGNWLLTPYDYSQFAFIYNSQVNIQAPQSLEDLTKTEYKKKIILMDSRTSTMGVGFEQWVRSVYPDDESYNSYMKRLEPSILAVAPGWSVGYGMFTNGEAPLCFSYATSPAYHIEYGEGDQYKALKFSDAPVMQVEGAGIVKGTKNLSGAKKFIEFLISDEAQNIIPRTQWMFPANKNIELPQSYKLAGF